MANQAQQDALSAVNAAAAAVPQAVQAAQTVAQVAAAATATPIVGAATAGAATASAAGAGTAGAAAAGAAAVPVVGWIVAGGIIAAAATISIVKSVRAAKLRRQEAIDLATQSGIDPETIDPGFIVKVLQNGPAWRGKQMARLAQRTNGGRAHSKDAARLRTLAAVHLIEQGAANGYEPPAAPAPVLVQEYPPTPGASWWPWVTSGSIAIVLIAAALRARG